MIRTIDTIWTRIALGLVLAQTAAAVFLPPSALLTALGDSFPCLLALVVMLSFGSNRRQSSGTVRLFWMLSETGFGILCVSQLVWFHYDVVLRRAAPNPIAGDGLFLLALVPTLAALTLRPHAESASGNLRFRRLDFLLLLFWWVCLYFYFALPWQLVIRSYPNYNPAYYVLALAEHCAALVAVGALYVKSQGSWKRFYRQFFFALSAFAAGSLLQNIFIDRGLYYTGSFYDVPWGFSLAMVTVAAALGAKLESHPARSNDAPRNRGMWSARLAMIGVISLPLLAIATVFDHNTPQPIVVFRLRLIFGAVLFLGSLTFLKLSSMDRELLRLIGSTESSLESLKLVQKQILESQRMAALGRLAAGATHEISNPLTAILGYAELLRDNPTLTEQDHQSVKDIQGQVHLAQAAINGMRRFVSVEAEADKSPSPELKTL
ncbi:MAG TPA: histidine kinase dimerization/phospho-acceptor domain-containing protein [Candidatus Acidoferrum sp.]|nr:histidine kinase dimerization/phospho-acceptor domain-containing protein [Candidatus Acidoferrum sp.]